MNFAFESLARGERANPKMPNPDIFRICLLLRFLFSANQFSVHNKRSDGNPLRFLGWWILAELLLIAAATSYALDKNIIIASGCIALAVLFAVAKLKGQKNIDV